MIEPIETLLLELLRENWAPILFITMALESALIPIPSELVVPFTGYLMGLWRLGFQAVLLVTLIASLANLAGGLLAYFWGKKLGRGFLLKFGKYLLISQEHISKAEKAFERHGEKAVLISRMLPAIRTVISFPAGVFQVPLPHFILFTFLGSLPWNFSLALLGYLLGENWKLVKAYMHILLVVLAPILLLLLFRWFKKWGSGV